MPSNIETIEYKNSELISFGMLVCNVVQVCALWNISVGTHFSFVMCSRDGKPPRSMVIWKAFSNCTGSEKVGRFYVCTTRILISWPLQLWFKKNATSKCAVAFQCSRLCSKLSYSRVNPERLSFFDFHCSICFDTEAFLAFKAFYRINCKSSVSKFILIFEHSDSDYTFLVMFPGCSTSNLTAGVTCNGYV